MKGLGVALVLMWWFAGIVIAQGFWSTFFAIVFFPWGWYLAMEKALRMAGVI